MKKLFSYMFIAILLLNVMGYYVLFLGLHYQNDVAAVADLDKNQYDESAAITIEIPVSIAYMPDQADFERVNGKFEYKGEHYRLVKQKYAKDVLTIVCIKDSESKRLDLALSDYVKTFTDHTSDQGKNTKTTLSFIKDYIPQQFMLGNVTNGWQADVVKYGFCISLIPSYTPSVIHPPERA
ncbi:MAG TPA: hypothetical protein VGD40_09035 [Chryseosolibacter sp.]